MKKEVLAFVQDQISYNFKNPELLEQAFTRRSYAEEHGGEDNEVLEFIGDKALDIIVVKLLTEKFGHYSKEYNDPSWWNKTIYSGKFICDYNEGRLTEIKAQLVNKRMLADRMEVLGFAKHLIMGQGDKRANINKENSVKEDLFEAILGAVALDSDWNLSKLYGVVEIMLDPDSYFNDEDKNYVQLIQDWVANNNGGKLLYQFENLGFQSLWRALSCETSQLSSVLSGTNAQLHCNIQIANDLPTFPGLGKSQIETLKAACKNAYHYLEQQGLLSTIKDEIENPNKKEAINQLEILARRGYFSIPTYDFDQTYNKDGNTIWSCECHIAEYDKCFFAKSSSKKDAKKTAAYGMLQFVLEIGEE